MMNYVDNIWDFPVLADVSFQNANRVHPLMQGRVERLIRELKKKTKKQIIPEDRKHGIVII